MASSFYHRGAGALERVRMLRMAGSLGVPDAMVFFGAAPGDDLLCTAVLKELKSRGYGSLWMMSKYPEIFAGNSDVARVVPIEDIFRKYVQQRAGKYLALDYGAVDSEEGSTVSPDKHIIAILCEKSGISGSIELLPRFRMAPHEKAGAKWADGMIAVQSSSLGAVHPMQNKQWFPERVQEVVTILRRRFSFVQLGSASDPILENCLDLRGKTNIREAAAVLANCRLFVGNVGFLMHLARATECPAVIVYGGREAPWQSGYSCNVNLYSPVSCAPCWLWNRCDHGRVCMDQIRAQHVVEAIGQIDGRPPGLLSIDRAFI